MKNFEELKQEILRRAKSEGACKEQYQRAYKSETIEELIEVIKDNISWNNNHKILTADLANEFENPKIFNHGESNVGLFNSGDLNSGDLNSGDLNSGYRNSGDLNSGYRNSGDLNSGYRNSGVFCTRKREDTIPFFQPREQYDLG